MSAKRRMHIGRIIEKKLAEKKMTRAEFARRLYLDRSSVYNIFSKETLDVDRLQQISEILEFDFLSLYSGKNRNYSVKTTLELDESMISALENGEKVQVTLELKKNKGPDNEDNVE